MSIQMRQRTNHCLKRPTTKFFGLVKTWKKHEIHPKDVTVRPWGGIDWCLYEVITACNHCGVRERFWGIRQHEVDNLVRGINTAWDKRKPD